MNTREYYNINAKEFSESTLNSDMSELYLQFEKYLKPGCKILDLGCGSGRDSIYFINNGYEVISFDYSEELARLASINIGKDVIIGDMREIDFEYSFDAIWASASILHIKRSEIDNVLFRLHKSLKKSGILYASFKWGDEEIIKNGRFFNCYNNEGFTKLMTENNFEIIKVWNSMDVRPERASEMWTNGLVRKY